MTHLSYPVPGEGKPASARLSGQIRDLAERCRGHELTLGGMVSVIHGRSYALFLFLAALPFCSPVPSFGLSAPFGLAIALIGLRLAVGEKPLLPRRVQAVVLPQRFFPALLEGTARLIAVLEKCLRPRGAAWVHHRWLGHLWGLIIAVAGLLLMLPLPIPLSNFFPAGSIVLIAAGLLEDDLLAIGLGLLFFLCAVAFFVFLGYGGWEVWEAIRDRLAQEV